MPSLTPFDVDVMRTNEEDEEELVKSVPVIPLVEHSGNKGPNWTLHPDFSPGGPRSIKFKGKKDVRVYFERKYPKKEGYSIEID